MSGTQVAGLQRGNKGQWNITARNGVHIAISWTVSSDGRSVEGEIFDATATTPYPFKLGLVYPAAIEITQPLVSIDVTLSLTPNGRIISLVCNVPLSINKFFNAPIGEWTTAAPPEDPPDEHNASLVDEPHEAMDIAPFIWLHPLTAGESLDVSLRFILFPQTLQDFPLYDTLRKCNDAPCKIAAANAQKSALIAAANALKNAAPDSPPAPITDFSQLRVKCLTTLQGTQTLDALNQEVQVLLGGQSITDVLNSTAWKNAQAVAWQVLFVVALTGTSADARVATDMVELLQVVHFLTLLAQGLPALEAPSARTVALNATAVLPDVVATTSLNANANPAPAAPSDTTTPSDKTSPGSWQVLGPATLKRTRQHLIGYQPGELAEVVNVMPHERQERQEQISSRREEHDSDNSETRGETDELRQSSASSELTDALQEVMATDGQARNMSDVKPSYENLNEMLSGTWSGASGGAFWSGADTSRQIQQLTEKAARHVGDRITRQRGRAWQELCERRHSNLIDNAGDQRLVGIYHWVDKVIKVHLADAGRRLILGFTVNQPAQPWIQQLTAQGDTPLEKPYTMPAFLTPRGLGYKRITPDNYLTCCALYGISDPEPPPADQLRLVATVSRVVLGDTEILHIPNGYQAESVTVTMALADAQYSLACSVAGKDIEPATSPIPPAALNAVVPDTSASTKVGTATVTPPTAPTALVNTVSLSSLKGQTGPIPLTVMSAAPLFSVTVDITCTRITPPKDPSDKDPSDNDRLMMAWQIRTYERLLLAWQAAMHRYQDAFGKRMKLACEGRTQEIQRDTLGQACLALMAPPPANPQPLEPLLSWADMSWYYDTQPLINNGIHPKAIAAASTASANERMFQRFLNAATANILLPVKRGCETALLFYLQFPAPWVADRSSTPITQSTLMLLEELLGPDPAAPELPPPRHWTVRLPTSMLYLQQGTELPGL